VIKEATATVFVFRDGGDGEWLLGLMFHPRFGGWLTPGGHVERDESPAEAAVRETAEELGCDIRLLAGPSAPLPAGYPHQHVAAARWIVEMPASPDNHTPELHVHLDHVFVGLHVADARDPETRVWWARERDVAEAPDLPEDVRMPAKELFAEIGRLARSPGGYPAAH
jgi:8-oxo-dGTP pyrophosphatase MutT (NUDIX family)